MKNILLHTMLFLGLTGITNTTLRAAAAHKNPGAIDQYGCSELMQALQSKKKTVAKALIANKADIHHRSFNGDTAVIFAAKRRDDLKILDLLIKQKANIAALNLQDINALFIAAQEGNDATVARLLKETPPLDAHESAMNHTPLTIAILNGHKSVVQQLIKAKANVTERCAQNKTPLELAQQRAKEYPQESHLKTIVTLLTEELSEQQARHSSNDPMMPQVPQLSTLGDPLYNAVEQDQSEILAALLESNIDPNQQYKELNGGTALHRAPTAVITQQLIDAKADPNALNRDNITPLMCAAKRGLLPVVETLLNAHADPARYSNEGFSALAYAIEDGHLRIAKLLLQTIPNSLDTPCKKWGFTPLLVAADNDHPHLVTYLLEQKADPNKSNDFGITPLMMASDRKATDPLIITNLLAHNANVDAVDNTGATAFMYASQKNNVEVMKTLIDAQADVHIKEKNHEMSAIVAAARNGHEEAVELILAHAQITQKDLHQAFYAAKSHKTLTPCMDTLLVKALTQHASASAPLNDSNKTPCANPECQKSGKNVCSQCLTVHYCSPACQRADWKKHKKTCSKSEATPEHKQEEATPSDAATLPSAQADTPSSYSSKNAAPCNPKSYPQQLNQAISPDAEKESKKLAEKTEAERKEKLTQESHNLYQSLIDYNDAKALKTDPTNRLKQARLNLQDLAVTHQYQLYGKNNTKPNQTALRKALTEINDPNRKSQHKKKTKPIAAPQPTPAPTLSRQHRGQLAATAVKAQEHTQLNISPATETSDNRDTQTTAHMPQPRHSNSEKITQQAPSSTPEEPFYDSTRVALVPLRPASDEPRNDQVLLKPNLIPIRYGQDTFYLDKVHLFEGESGNRGLHHDYKQQLRNSRFRKYAYEPIAIAGQANGCYSLEGNEGDERVYKSFFPSDWNAKTLEKNIEHALKNEIRFFYKSERNNNSSHCFCGFMKRPIPIYFRGILYPGTNIIKSIYPITEEEYNTEQSIYTALARSQEEAKQQRKQRQPRQSANNRTAHPPAAQNTTPAPTGPRLNPLAKPWAPLQLLQEAGPADNDSDEKENDVSDQDPELEHGMAASRETTVENGTKNDLGDAIAASMLDFNQR